MTHATAATQAPDRKTLDIETIRADFPILQETVNGKLLVYLDNAASSQKPIAVLDAMDHYYRTSHANVHRGAHTLGDRATTAYEGAREKVRAFINADSTREIVWTRGTTEAINIVANGLAERLKPGDEILLTHMEHHANIVPWQMICERTGAKIRVIAVSDRGELDQASFEELLNERTRVMSLGHVSNVLGTINPVREMVAKAKQRGVITVLDGAQAVPHLKVDVKALDCDFYMFSSHKLFGPTGIGVLYGREAILGELPPYQGGGEMIERVTFEKTTWADLPHRFEAGTPAIAEAVGLGAAIDYLLGLNRELVEAAERALLERANSLVESVPGLSIMGTAADKVPVFSFQIKGLHASDIGTLLDQQGIAIRTGNHCAMPLMARFGETGSARASFAFYNTLDEVDQFFQALAKVQRLFAE